MQARIFLAIMTVVFVTVAVWVSNNPRDFCKKTAAVWQGLADHFERPFQCKVVTFEPAARN